MGVVYHAYQTEPIYRDVALKVIKPGMDSQWVITRFETERQALAVMDHPNVCRVLDAGTTEVGRPYFVMELVEGIPITRYCDSRRLTVRERIELFIPVCQAIQHAHQKGIIHRDIKPSNILITQQEGRPVPKVIDFGLAKAVGPQMSAATMLVNVGMILGTLEYMSPEQAHPGRHDIDTRSDVYSLGAVFYELLTGTTPLERERTSKAGYGDVLERIREEEPLPPSARVRSETTSAEAAARRHSDPSHLQKLLHGELDWIAMKALEKDRTRRYETVNGLVRDLQRYLDGEPVEAGRPTAGYRLGKFVRKHQVGLATAAAFVALLVAGVVVSAWMAVRAMRAEAEARAVNDFLQQDVLAQASANNQAGSSSPLDKDLKVRTALDRAAARIEGKFANQPAVEAAIRSTIGSAYSDIGLYPEAQRQFERVMDIRLRTRGAKSPDTLSTMYNLAVVYRREGKYAQAEPLFASTVDSQRRVLGEQHPDTLASMNSLGTVYFLEGRYAQAEELLAKVLEARKNLRGEEHQDTLASMNNLAAVYISEGKHAQAEPLLARTLEIRRRISGPEHPNTLKAMGSLAVAYNKQGKFAPAELLLEEALRLQGRVVGWEHPDTLQLSNNLAETYRKQGKYMEAEAILIRTIDAQRRVIGEEHPATIASMNSKIELYLDQGSYTKAEELLMAALKISRRVLGEEHPDTLYDLQLLGELYRRQHRYTQAEPLLTTVALRRRHSLGERNADTLWTLALLADTKLDEHKYTEAEPLLREALGGYEAAMADRWERYYCQTMLGATLAAQGNHNEAEAILLSGYQGLSEREVTIPAGTRYVLTDSEKRIVESYLRWEKPDKAAEWQRRLASRRTPLVPARKHH